MRRVRWLAVLAFLLIPGTAQAIQLHWSSGADTLTFTEATRCMLIVQADSAEATLPPQWRLLWVGDSTEVEVVALDSLEVCEGDTAQVYDLDEPATPEDSTAHRVTARFCSGGSNAAGQATFLLDLPAWGRGKLKVVALDPADSTSVIESNEVTFNGGVSDAYGSVILCATSIHQSLQLQVTAIGTGLLATRSLSIAAPDSSWSLPLTITGKSDNGVTAVASVAALLPACLVSVESQRGSVSSATIPADPEPPSDALAGGSCATQYFETLLGDPPYLHGYTIQPKDFAFTAGFVDATSNRYALHLFYIRHNYWYADFYDQYGQHHTAQPDLDERNIGHTWSTTLDPWQNTPTDTNAIVVRPGKFDELHVWAPTIIKLGPTFHMFYTGVKKDQGGRPHQRIGVATSTDLNSWTQSDAVVLSAPDIQWASKNPKWKPYFGAQQLRDPFVMEDPVHSGQWLMYFVSVDSMNASADTTIQLRMAVGVARSSDLRNWYALPKPFCGTEKPTSMSAAVVVESPHVFRRNGQWWMPYTVDNDRVFFETSASADPADTVTAHWTGPIRLQAVSQEQPAPLTYWHATEHLGGGPYEYLAAWDDNASSIDIMGVFAADDPSVDSLKLGCPVDPPPAGVGDLSGSRHELNLVVTHLQLGAPEVGLRLELPSRMPVRLAVYDIAGRRRSTLLDGEVPAGVTEVKWDGRDDSGDRVASGVYFVGVACVMGARVSKIVLLR